MATIALPTSGSYPVEFSSSLFDQSAEVDSSEEIIAFKYAFKPNSITTNTPGKLECTGSGKQVIFDVQKGGQQVFDAREDQAKSRECILVWDEDTQSYTLHAVHTTLNLTLNRTLSASSRRTPPSASSSSRSPSPALTKRKVQNEPGPASASQPTDSKKPRRSEVTPSSTRPKYAGKSLPLAQSQASKKSTLPKTGKGQGKGKKAPVPALNGKYKSAEIIDDSDDSAEGGGEQEEEGEGEDEFASLLREGLEGKEEEAADESEDEFESESGEEDLAGSKPVSRSQGAPMMDGESEWL